MDSTEEREPKSLSPPQIHTDTSASDEEKFEDASSKDFNEKAVDELIREVTGLHPAGDSGTLQKNNTSSSSDHTDKFVDCRSDPDGSDEDITEEVAQPEEAEPGSVTERKACEDEDYVDDKMQAEWEESLPEQEKLDNKERADELKAKGNELFKEGDYEKSAKMYTAALRLCPVRYAAERSILYANRAAAKTKLNFKPSAIADCTKAIQHNPKYLKALLRRATLYEEADKLDESLEDFKQILELDPSNAEARAAQQRLPPKIQERNEALKEEMVGKLKDLGNMILRPFGLSTQNFELKQDPSTGSYSVNFKSGK
ncbi:tetratricopeptide repeat protein 1 isoform X2 [Uranotaenia lowii]|uniref:tetratricopeptide repeat protein 1 isoform X2 n=1 Tax=Uranotaenia lowii TaxID=190385 RepID=UPI0024793BD8|nr:tetratricopeptide repeat protein 1 isoform X2 [Uranotaenia lowii]